MRDRYLLSDHIFCIPVSKCLIADTEVPENSHQAYRIKFLLNVWVLEILDVTYNYYYTTNNTHTGCPKKKYLSEI